jgi:hypothetical protein
MGYRLTVPPYYLAAMLGLLLSICSTSAFASPVERLEAVGSATLRVLLWTIYDSRLYSPDGNYEGIEPDLALEITYRRDIKAQDLLERTRKEWRELGLYEAGHEQWLKQLAGLWPDVKEDDSLVLRVDENLASQFFFNGQAIGAIASAEFTRNFLAIWLSENSSYPKLRNRLVGLSD